MLAGGLLLVIRTDSFHEFIGNFKPITYVELVELIEGSEVDRIRIKRITEGKDMHNKAYIMTRNGNVRVLELGNVDHFLEAIETLQVGKTSSSTGVIPLEFEFKRDALRVMEKAASIGSALVFIALFVSMLKAFRYFFFFIVKIEI
jgi:hypothetical protein